MFAVSVESPRSKRAAFRHATPEAAEKAARQFVAMRGGEISIWTTEKSPALRGLPKEIAVVLTDNLGRMWTQVFAVPGETALL